MESPSPVSPPNKQFLAVFGPTRTFPTDLMMVRTGDEDGSDEGSIGMRLSYLESITEEEDSSSDAMEEGDDGEDDEEIYPVIESAPEEGGGGGGEGYFDGLFSERGAPLIPFGPDAANSDDFLSIIGGDTDHFGRPRTASRPNTPMADKKKIEFAAAQTGCIDCIVGSAGHNHGPTAGRSSPAPPTPAPSRSSSVKLKEPPLSPVQEERGDAIEEKNLETTFTTFTTLTPDTTPLKQQEPNSLATTNETTTPATAFFSEQTPPARSSYSLPERPKLATTNIYPITPARQQRAPQIPPTPPTTPARRKSLYSREFTSVSVRDVAPAGTLTPPPSEVASSVIEEQPKKEAGEAEPGHGEDGHECPYLRRSASGRDLPHSLTYSYSVPSTPEPVQIPAHSKSSPEVPRLSTHFHSGPSTPSPETSRLLSYNRTRPMTPRVLGRRSSQENSDRSVTPEVVFSGSGLASPFMDVSEPASRAPSPPPPSLAEGSTTTTPAASVILPPAATTTTRSPLAPAIALKGDSGASKRKNPAGDDKPQLPGQTSKSITMEAIHRFKFPAPDATLIVHHLAKRLDLVSDLIIKSWLALIPFTLFIWTFASVAKMFIPADEGSALEAFDPAYAVPLYAVLFIAVALYRHGESHDVYDDILRVARETFSRRRLRRVGITLLAAGAVAGAMFVAVAAAPYLASLIARLAAYAVNRYSPPPSSPPPPALEPWEADMDFVYFAPTGAEEKAMHMASAMEPGAYGPYYPGMEDAETGKGIRWGDLIRIGVVLVMGPAGAVALRRRTL